MPRSNTLRLIQFLLIFLFNYHFCNSQIYEVGATIGGTNFIGDVGNTTFINPNESAFGGIVKWNRSPRHAYRFSFITGTISANDLDSNDPRRNERGYNFSTSLKEFSTGMEFNFFDYNLHEYDVLFTPYIYSGIIYSKYENLLFNGNNLQNSGDYEWSLGIPMVLGVKYRIFEKIILSFEIGARYTFSDKIDGSQPYNENFNFTFGNENNNDWYMFSGFNLTYTFGRQPCYCNIK